MPFFRNENQVGMKQRSFHKILVANRGEIALRVIRAIQELDKIAIVVHSDFDKELPFVTEADEAYSLGSGNLDQTYLNIHKILDIASESQADAIHPGYGFLAENSDFAEACRIQRIHFIGPSPEVISMMGHKSNARAKAIELGIPVLEGVVENLENLIDQKEGFAYPILIKPSAGGGGKGMRIVQSAETFESEAREAVREAKNYFGLEDLYVERFLENPRHIEVQVLADHHGNMVHLYERECSLQRRYQKIIEEAPSGSISKSTREQITAVAIKLVHGIGYTNAGTVEFLMDFDSNFYFLEMNTRIQVEHPVSEMITGIDLVKEQIHISEGFPLSFNQQDITILGHSMEARIYAENPENDFLPSTGRIDTFQLPEQNGVRIDSGFKTGNLVEPYYDPMLAKVIVFGKSRDEARNRLIGALKEVRIKGLRTNRDFLIELLRSVPFKENTIHTGYIDQEMDSLVSNERKNRSKLEIGVLLSAATLIALQTKLQSESEATSPWFFIGHWRILPEIILLSDGNEYRIRYELLKGRERMRLHLDKKDYEVALERRDGDNYWIRINHQILKVWGSTDRSEILLDMDGHLHRIRRTDILDRRYIRSATNNEKESNGKITAPLNGYIVQINVMVGDKVSEGDPLLVIESMKMENKILAANQATVEDILVSVGEQVQTNQILLTLALI